MKIIEKEDIKILENIAEKYKVDLKELGQYLIKKDTERLVHQIRVNADELSIINNKADKLNMKRSEYVRSCFLKIINDGTFILTDISEIKKTSRNQKRDIKIPISFNNIDEYMKMRTLAKKYSLSFASFLRYISLSTELE